MADLNFTGYIISLLFLLAMYFIFGTFALKKYLMQKKEEGSAEEFNLFYAFRFYFLGLGRFILAIFDVITDFNSKNYHPSNIWIWKIGSGLQFIGVGVYFYLMEKRVMRGRDKYLLLIIFFALPAFGLIFMQEVETATIFIALGLIVGIYVPLAYLYIAKISDGEVRKKALYIFLGFVIMVVGSSLPAEQVISVLTQITPLVRIQVHVIAFWTIICGGVFLFLGVK